MKKMYIARAISCFLCMVLIFTLLPGSVLAEQPESDTIRTAWYADVYNNTGSDGNRRGYVYEYQQAVASYTGWTYEYKEAEWSELLQMVQNGEIDLMGGVSYTEERSKTLLFSELPMGVEKYYIYADFMDTDISISNLETLNGRKIGLLKNSVQETYLSDWEEKNDIHLQRVYVRDFEDAREKVDKQEIDCVLSVENSAWVKEGLAAVVNIGSSDIYFVISKKRLDLKKELDDAMRKMEFDKPFYVDELYKKYISAESIEVLSREELEWLKGHGKIKIGYLDNDAGVSVLDKQSGEVTGIINEYVTYASNCLQNAELEFELTGFDSREKQMQALQDGGIDMVFHISQNPSAAEQGGYILSNTVWVFNMAAITANDYFDENEENSVAVIKDNLALKQYISYFYPEWKIVEYDSLKQAEKAVESRQADCLVTRSNQVVKYLENHRLHSVFLTQPGNVSFAVKRGNSTLLSILNKTLKTTQTTRFTSAAASYDRSADKVTFGEFMKDNLLAVTLVFTGVLLLVLFIFIVLLHRAKIAAHNAVELNNKLKVKQEELQEALVQAESANASKTTFLNNMSHDIRTPINGIIGMLTIIRKNENDPGRVKDCLDKIEASSNLLLSLVNDVLDMAKLETGTVILNNESVNLDQVCDEITKSVSFQAEDAGIHVTGEHDDYEGIYVWSSALHLKKILMNLFTNSIKYNKPNGSIHVSMRTLEKSEETITCEFKIQDTGLGMTEEFVKNKLFVPFVQEDNSARSSYMGTGLGMPIVKQLVEKMGGTIKVESKLGEGSCFTVVLPFQLDTQGKQETVENKPQADIEGVRVLLVEDNELNMEIAEYMLTDSGAKVVCVKNGLEALQEFEASEAGTYDAILMDVMMPVMDGLTATKKIRELNRPDAKTIPVIAMTANAFKEDAEKCLQAGMNEHLAKPLEIDKVIRTIFYYCRQRKGFENAKDN